MAERTLPSPGDCELIVHRALEARDMEGVRAGLIALAVQDPKRAQILRDLMLIALELGSFDQDPPNSLK